MSPVFLRHLIAELAPLVEGARVRDARTTGAATVLLEIGPRVLTVAAEPPGALFLSQGGLPGGPSRERSPLERELRGATLVALRQAGTDPRVEIALLCEDDVGRSRKRVLTGDLGRRAGLTLGDEAAVPRKRGGGVGTGAGAPGAGGEPAHRGARPTRRGPVPAQHGPAIPTVSWRRDERGALHVRLTAAALAGDFGESRTFASFNDAAAFAHAEFARTLALEGSRRRLAKLAAAALDRKLRAAASVRAEIEESRRAEEYRHKAGLLLARKASVRKGESTARVLDYDNATIVEIEMNPALGLARNAELLFARARRAERRRARAPARLAELTREADGARELLDAIGSADEATLVSIEARLAPPARVRVLPREQPPGERARFRTYTVSGGWQVLVGKSNADNDVLTHRIARPDDIWFHARQAAGSHVVLRKSGTGREPDRAAILEAAAIAAYHSKAGKGGRVAVCYTERRHVRKPRGGKPGLAVVTREKVVMVEPRLPES